MASFAAAIGVVRASVGGHVGDAEILLSAEFANVMRFFAAFVGLVMVPWPFGVSEAKVGGQAGGGGKTLSTEFTDEIRHRGFSFGLASRGQ